MAGFVRVCTTSDVPDGEARRFVIEGREVAVANAGGSFYAFQDECTHQACSLTDGDLEGTAIVCSCHNAEFDVTTGAVLAGPATAPVPAYPVRVEGDEVQAQL